MITVTETVRKAPGFWPPAIGYPGPRPPRPGPCVPSYLCFPYFLLADCPQHLNAAENVNPDLGLRMEPPEPCSFPKETATAASIRAPTVTWAPALHPVSSPLVVAGGQVIPEKCQELGLPGDLLQAAGGWGGGASPGQGSRAGRATAQPPPAGQGQPRSLPSGNPGASETPGLPLPGLRDLGREAVATYPLLCHLLVAT